MMNSIVDFALTYIEWVVIPLSIALLRQQYLLMRHRQDIALLDQRLEQLERSASRSEESLHHTEHAITRIKTQLEDWE